MKLANKMLIVSLIALICISGCIGQATSKPTTEGLAKACSSDNYDRIFFECEKNSFSAAYAAINTNDNIADVPNTYYDAQGNEIRTCGGLAINTIECDALLSIKCEKSVSCPP